MANRKPIGFIIAASIILIILTGVTIHFQKIKNSHQKEFEQVKKTYLSVNKNAAEIEKSKKQRIDFFKRRFYLNLPLKYTYSAANFTRKLSLIAAGKIRFTKMEITPGNHTFTFLLKGRIEADGKRAARSGFIAFYRELESLENVLRIKSSNAQGVFTVTGEIELE